MISDQNRSAAGTQSPVAVITTGGRGMGAAIARELDARCSWPSTRTDVAGTIPMRRIGTMVEIARRRRSSFPTAPVISRDRTFPSTAASPITSDI
jgi:hypothetical protein